LVDLQGFLEIAGREAMIGETAQPSSEGNAGWTGAK
jgi:hypothetical protein